MAKNLLFTFEDLSVKDKAAKALERLFKRGGSQVVQQEASASVKRSSGVSYRELALTFADSQQVTLRVKQTGDIYQVLINGKVFPLRFPDDHEKAIQEVIKAMDGKRAAFQKKLAAAKVALPPSIKTAAPKLKQALVQKRDDLKAAIEAVKEEAAKIAGTAEAASA